MDINKDILTIDDFDEPYASLVYRIGVANTIKFISKFSGRQMSFKKWDIKESKCYKEIEDLFGSELAIKIVKLYSGNTIYFPEIKTACKKKIRTLINNEFNGYNYTELAKKFGYSERHIHRIINKKNKKVNNFSDKQLTFFDKL